MVKVKICGVTNPDDALRAVEYGADALGFNFYLRSPRYIQPEDASVILRELPAGICTAGLFVNESRQHVKSVLRACRAGGGPGLTAAQFHGDEDPNYCTRWPLKVIKAFRVRNAETIRKIAEYPVDYYLLDSWSPGFGGSGSTFVWGWLDVPVARPVIVAGGLDVKNVGVAVRGLKPFGVDVCTGVEATPGRKDHERMKDFIAAAKAE